MPRRPAQRLGLALLSVCASAAARRVEHRFSPVHLQAQATVATPPLPPPPVLAIAGGHAALPYIDRARPLDEGVRSMLEARAWAELTPQAGAPAELVTPGSAEFDGAVPWGSTLTASASRVGHELWGTWLTTEGPDQWSFHFNFGRFGILKCLAEHRGDTWVMPDLITDFSEQGRHVTSAREVLSSQGGSTASFSFRLNEKEDPGVLTAQIDYHDGRQSVKATAARPET